MKLDNINNFKNNLVLYELKNELDFFLNLYNIKKFPNVLMLSGKKGIGKYTIIKHFLSYVYDKENYDLKSNTISDQTTFFKQFSNNVYPNIIYLSGSHFLKIKIDDIRNLKSMILKSASLNKERFIVLDDIELFNTSSLNALLKIIEEPTINNYFILINSKTRSLVETITSRALEVRISLTNEMRVNIIKSLVEKNNLEVFIDYKTSNLSPGNFIIFNKICEINKIDPDESFILNLNKLLNLFKKNKDLEFINMMLYLTNIFFYNLQNKDKDKIEKIMKNKDFVIDNINKFITYNLNQTSLINAINSKLLNE